MLFISFFLYFSRTMWVAIILLLIGSFGYSRISLKAIKYISLALILIFSLYVYLYSIDIERDQKGFSAFLYKVKIAPEEIFHTNIDINNQLLLFIDPILFWGSASKGKSLPGEINAGLPNPIHSKRITVPGYLNLLNGIVILKSLFIQNGFRFLKGNA